MGLLSPRRPLPLKLSGEGKGRWEGPGRGAQCAVITQSCGPLLQQLDLHQLVDGGCILQPLDQGVHEVLVIAREDTQVVPGLVLQLLIPIGVQTHEDGGSARGQDRGMSGLGPSATVPFLGSFVCFVAASSLFPFSLGPTMTRLPSPPSTP